MYRPKYVCYCPYYEGEYRKAICCSGVDEATKNVMYFVSEEQKCEFVKRHCTHDKPNCKIFNILDDMS